MAMAMDDKFLRVTFNFDTPRAPGEFRPESKGRNGPISTTGLEIYTNDVDNLVRVSPVTSRGDVSEACYVELPFDKQTLLEMAAKFSLLANQAPGPVELAPVRPPAGSDSN